MPVYEFTCNSCHAPVSVFVRSMSSPVNGKCDRCGSTDLRRLISRFAVLQKGGGLGAMDDVSFMENMDENDPRAMAAWARRMQAEMGEDAGPEFNDMVERLERGESLDDEGLGGQSHDDDLGGFGGLGDF
jgi:putative FmdB family regulatory protein